MHRASSWAVAFVFSLAVGCAESTLGEPPAMPPPPPPIPAGAVPPHPGRTLPAELDDAGATPTSSEAPLVPAEPAPAAPPEGQWSVTYATGRWVYADGYGWMWIPNDAGYDVMDDVPYVYLYTPMYGWTWYVSPWGYGPYHYGVWVHRPWRPVGWHAGWVARPHVIVHIGGSYHGHGHAGYHGGGHRHR